MRKDEDSIFCPCNMKKFSRKTQNGPQKGQYTMFSISRSFSPFSNNHLLFQDFRRLPKISEDYRRFPRRNLTLFLSSLYSHGKEIIFAVYRFEFFLGEKSVEL